jgi:hypothetical protein
MQVISAAGVLPHVDHSACDDSVTQHADALVIERSPLPKSIGLAQCGELFVWPNVPIHFPKFLKTE